MNKRPDNFYELFECDDPEEYQIILKLKYGNRARASFSEVLDALGNEPVEVQYAVFAASNQYSFEHGFYDYPDEDNIRRMNNTLVQNFIEKFGWDREALLDRLLGY